LCIKTSMQDEGEDHKKDETTQESLNGKHF
jgi:hypothetical protein